MFWSALAQVMAFALIGTLIGLVFGAALPYAAILAFGHLLPYPLVPGVYASELTLGFAYGLVAALTFSILPLARGKAVAASTLFRDAFGGEAFRPYGSPAARADARGFRKPRGALRLRPLDRDALSRLGRRGNHRASACRDGRDGDRPDPAALLLADPASCHRQPAPARQPDALGHALPRPRADPACHADSDRHQPRPAVPLGAARRCADLLLRRYPLARDRSLRSLLEGGRTGREG
ncbi:MAG TPA: hypothetical protein PKW21_04165 [Rhabdaerophilum sp.]|nr:hypothetical protein [Rhabdaerophilum sp.]